MPQIIPTTPTPDYEFLIDLEDQTLQMRIRWNSIEGAWYLDITGVSFTLELQPLKLVGGVDLLKPHAVLELGGLQILDTEEKFEDPDFDLMGDRYKLMYIPIAELNDFTF